MKIGTHNTMTYLKPKKWYLYPFRFIARCQSLSIKEQYDLGVRIFDIRITYDKKGRVEFRHGLIAYKGDVYDTLAWLNSHNVPIKIRILLEEGKESPEKEFLFIRDLNRFQIIYPNLSFYEGRRKFDWKQLVKLPNLDVTQIVSSMQGNKIDDLWPWLYAKLHNKENLEKYKYKEYILMDFINEPTNGINT